MGEAEHMCPDSRSGARWDLEAVWRNCGSTTRDAKGAWRRGTALGIEIPEARFRSSERAQEGRVG